MFSYFCIVFSLAMKRINISLLSLLLVLCVVFSCGTATKLLDSSSNTPTSSEVAFQNAFNSGSIDEMIACAKKFPETEESVIDCLIWDFGLESMSYNDICAYIKKTESAPLLNSCFDYYKGIAEDKMIEELSELSIEGVREYYGLHKNASIFLNEIINDAISEQIEEGDYFSLKLYHNAFLNSSFGNRIDKVYMPLRDSLLTDIMNVVDDYESNVNEVVNAVKAQVAYELDTLTINSINRMKKDCMDNKLPRRDKVAEERIQEMYKKFVNSSGAKKAVDDNISELLASIDESVMDLYRSVVFDVDSTRTFSDELVTKSYPSYKVLMKEFLNFSEIQRDINWVAIGLSAASVGASVVTAGTSLVVLALDGADLVYGIMADSKKAQKVASSLKKLGDDMYSSMNNSNKMAVNKSFDGLNKYIGSTFNNLRERINEEF